MSIKKETSQLVFIDNENQQRRDYERFPADYKDAPDKKLTPEQLNLLGKIKELEEKSELWEKTKEKATKMLWWEDVVEGLAKQSQQTEQSDTETEKDKTEDSSKQQTETSSTPATLSQNGEVWFMHPVAMVDCFNSKRKLWHEPLERPQRTCYSSNTNLNNWNGAFGFVRNQGAKAHTGLDLFADINTPCYACLDGEIVQYEVEGGYGNVLVIKVKGDDLRASRNDYTLEFNEPDKQEVVQADDFDINADHFYLRYCHLSDKRADLKVENKVKSGDLIGYTGNAKGLCNPHLHFEIAMKKNGNRTNTKNAQNDRLAYKINPAFFVNLQAIDVDEQTKVKERRIQEQVVKKK